MIYENTVHVGHTGHDVMDRCIHNGHTGAGRWSKWTVSVPDSETAERCDDVVLLSLRLMPLIVVLCHLLTCYVTQYVLFCNDWTVGLLSDRSVNSNYIISVCAQETCAVILYILLWSEKGRVDDIHL